MILYYYLIYLHYFFILGSKDVKKNLKLIANLSMVSMVENYIKLLYTMSKNDSFNYCSLYNFVVFQLPASYLEHHPSLVTCFDQSLKN